MSSKTQNLERLKGAAAGLDQDCASLDRDLSMWEGQTEAVKWTKKRLEQELGDLRGDFARKRLKLQELTDHIKPQNMTKESDLLLLSEHLVQLRRDATVRDMDLSSKIEALEELLRETQGQLGDSKAHGARVRNSPER